MLDHVSIEVSDYERSKSFYEAALTPLGVSLLMEFGSATAGFGVSSSFCSEGREECPRALT
jgi:catechol 2,3-dioxygenase-like lactoylglutathione lyase family enzyme